VVAASSLGKLFVYGSPTSLCISGPSIDFGIVIVGSPVTKTATLTASLTPSVPRITVTNFTLSNSNFTVARAPIFPFTLSNGQSFTLDITFNPVVSGLASGITTNLNFKMNEVNAGPGYVSLHGVARAKGPELTIHPTVLSFGGVVAGSGAVTANAQIQNTGSAAMTLTGIVLPNTPFSVLNPVAVGVVLAPGELVSISVTFNSSSVGQFSDKFIISSTGGTKTFIMSGAANGPPSLLIEIQNVDGSWDASQNGNLYLDLDFGNVYAGTTSTRSVRLTNIGQSVLTVEKSKLPFSVPGTVGITTVGAGIGEQYKLSAGEKAVTSVCYVCFLCDIDTFAYCSFFLMHLILKSAFLQFLLLLFGY
jgi:hypothetical protein